MTYTPADLGASVLDGAGDVLPWLGAAVGAAIGIMFALVGLRRAIQWARWMIDERSESALAEQREFEAFVAFNEAEDARYAADWDDAKALGWSDERAQAYADKEAGIREHNRLSSS